jgi:hypothetical protein
LSQSRLADDVQMILYVSGRARADARLGWLAFLGLLKNLVESGADWSAATAETRVAAPASS